MIVSTDQQAFSVTIMVKGCDDNSQPGGVTLHTEEKEMDNIQEEIGCEEKANHVQDVVSGLASLRKQGLLLDVKLWAQGQVFEAHRVVLASCSEYFRAMFTSGLRETNQGEIVLGGVTARGFSHILDYVYTSRLVLDTDCVEEVLDCASQLQIWNVVSKCGQFLIQNLEVESCVDILSLGDRFSLERVRHSSLRFMAENLSRFRRSCELPRLSLPQFLNLLNSNFPVDVAEGEVLAMVADWLESDLTTRVRWVDQVVDGVRLTEVPGREIAGLLDRPGLKSIRGKLQTLERLSPIRQSDTYKMVNSRGMKMALVKVGGFGPSGITNEISYYHCDEAVGESCWRLLSSVPHVECCNFGCAVLHNQLYIVGGCFNQGLQENIHPFGFRYCARLDKWSTMAAMNRERCRFSLTECGGRLYAVGGCSEGSLGEEDQLTVESYDPNSDQWTVCPGLPGGNRSQHAAVRVQERLYVSGGLDQDTVLSSLLEYRPSSGVWDILSDLPVPRADHSMLAFQDMIYLVGGWRDGADGRVLVGEIDRYDLSSNTWTVETVLPTPRYNAGVTFLGGKIYIIGGFLDNEMFDRATSSVDCYDMVSGEWRKEKPYPHHTWEHSLASLQVPVSRDDAVLVVS